MSYHGVKFVNFYFFLLAIYSIYISNVVPFPGFPSETPYLSPPPCSPSPESLLMDRVIHDFLTLFRIKKNTNSGISPRLIGDCRCRWHLGLENPKPACQNLSGEWGCQVSMAATWAFKGSSPWSRS